MKWYGALIISEKNLVLNNHKLLWAIDFLYGDWGFLILFTKEIYIEVKLKNKFLNEQKGYAKIDK